MTSALEREEVERESRLEQLGLGWRAVELGFGCRAALHRFLEQLRGVGFIIESKSDSRCLCFCVWDAGRQLSAVGLFSVAAAAVTGEGQSLADISV